jgi:hypothetical protein
MNSILNGQKLLTLDKTSLFPVFHDMPVSKEIFKNQRVDLSIFFGTEIA